MSLTVALNTAKQSLSANAVQTAIVSRNNAGANDAAYSRKSALLVTQPGDSESDFEGVYQFAEVFGDSYEWQGLRGA